MNKIRILIILCAGILLWSACTTDSDKNNRLSDAIKTVDDNPKEALALLEGLSPELYDYDKDQYMQFVVTLTQARYMDYQNITVDSLILDAERYFARSNNYEMAARASYYAAIYWYEEEANDKAVEYWLAAFSFAEQAGNNPFLFKSAYALGRSYYNQEQWEDALPYYKKALTFYDDQADLEDYKLDIINALGHIYRQLQDPEQAYRYFDDGLKAAKSLNDITYEARSLRNIGLIHYDKGEYRQAKEYFDLALSKQPEPGDMIRFYLSYARLYRAMNLPDSTRYYLNTIEDQVQEITYPSTRRDIYKELATYYKVNQGDVNKVAHYSQLAHTEDLRIKKSQTEKKIKAINQQLEQLKQEKQTEWRTYRRIFDYGLIALCLLISLLIILEANKQKLKEKYTQIKEKYIQSQKEYTQIKEEHTQIKDKYIKTNAEYTQAKEEYIQIKEKYLQAEKEYTQIKEEYTQTKNKYLLTDWENELAKEEYEKTKEKYYRISNHHYNLKLEHLYLSDAGLKSIAKSIDDLYEKKLAYAGSLVWEQLLMLRERFSDQYAGYAKIKLAKLDNGEAALLKLTPGYLAIIQLSSMKYPEEEIARMLGYKDGAKESLKLHKKRIHRILTKAGMTDKDIENLLPKKR
ncbi:MAG: tetratricopeptide repeat protein [Tannerella sp.]|jgi:tetratricopeptide (TPR) repeat protein|nr:tetratricopeptide repeat protein [Tannerella sp.]